MKKAKTNGMTVTGGGLKVTTKPNMIIGGDNNGYTPGDILDANAVSSSIQNVVSSSIQDTIYNTFSTDTIYTSDLLSDMMYYKKLIKRNKYILDYDYIPLYDYFKSKGSEFNLILTAISNDRFDSHVQLIVKPGKDIYDIYRYEAIYDFNAHRINYLADNKNKVKANFDFINLTIKVCKCIASPADSIIGEYVIYGTSIKGLVLDNNDYEYRLSVPNGCLNLDIQQDNIHNYSAIYIGRYSSGVIHNYSRFSVLAYYMDSYFYDVNDFIIKTSNNSTIKNSAHSENNNNIVVNSTNNIISDFFEHNIINADDFSNNNITGYFGNNKIITSFSNNIINKSVDGLMINVFNDNEIYGNLSHISIGLYFTGNTIYCDLYLAGLNCNSITCNAKKLYLYLTNCYRININNCYGDIRLSNCNNVTIDNCSDIELKNCNFTSINNMCENITAENLTRKTLYNLHNKQITDILGDSVKYVTENSEGVICTYSIEDIINKTQ